VLDVLYHRAKFGGAQISPAAVAAKKVEFLFVCLSVCLFGRHAYERQSLCARFRQEDVKVQIRFWYRWIGEGLWMCICPQLSYCRQLSTPLNAEVQKTAKMGVFAATWRQNKSIETNFGT